MAIERQKLIHLHTPEVKAPAVGSLEKGEIAVQHNAIEAALYIEKSNNEIAKFIDETAVDAKVAVEKLRAEGAEEALADRIDTLEGSNHTHENKGVLDGITAEKVAAWDAAESNAKANAAELYQPKGNYEVEGAAAQALADAKANAAELYQPKGNYEVEGAAAQALADAKDYADGKFQVAGSYEEAGAAAAVEGKLNAHKEDAVMHVTAQERLDWNAAKSAIDTFLADADMTESAVDTLKELQTYMTTDGEAATELVNRVSALEAIDHNAYVSADAQVLADAKSYVDGKVDGKFDEVGAAAQALVDAKAYVDGKVDGKFDEVGAAAQALVDAKAYSDENLATAKSYVDGKVDGKFDEVGAAAQALVDAKAYSDENLATAKSYVDGKVDGKFDEAGAAAQALVDAKSYVDGKVDGKFDEAGAAAQALADAKTYTNDAISAIKIDCGTY